VPVELTFEEIPNFRLVARVFDDMALAFENMRAPLAASAEVAAYDAARRFDEEGPGWAEWVLGYQHPKGHGTIGDLTGAMSERAGSPEEYRVGYDTVSYTLEPGKEETFQFGGRGTQAARPFIGLSVEGEDLVEAIFGEWMDTITGTFFGGGGVTLPPTLPYGIRLAPFRNPLTGGEVFRGAGGRFVPRPPGF
jgi:hypothetical protein